MSRKRVPLNQNECTADFGIGVPFEQNLHNGYMGYVEGKYILFASEQEYFEFMHYRGYIYVILELVLKDLVRT